jgi:hypothetical protein
MTQPRDPKTGRFVRADEPEEIPPFDRPDYSQQPAWNARDTAWAALGLFALVGALVWLLLK